LKADLGRMLDKYPYSAAQVWPRLRAQGFEGGASLGTADVHRIRPRQKPAFLKLAFAPGECAQVDGGAWSSVAVGHTRRRWRFCVMVLCDSRLRYVAFTVSQTMAHFLACHPHAFECFGGVPQKVMVDHLQSAVLQRILGQEPMLNPKYVDFANHMGCTIAPCNVGKGNEKGRVENGVGYVQKNVLAGLDLPPFSALTPAAKPWLATGANVRIHGETRQPPVALWQKEKPSLGSLPPHPFDSATVSQVRASKEFRITVATNRDSVPAQLAGQVLTLKT
jgi:transposase